MSAKLQNHVFVSYVREDAEQVEQLADDLRKHGIEVWLDKEKILPGQRWQDVIRQAIQDGVFFIACFSDAYAKRDESYINEELTLAIERLRQMPHDKVWFLPIRLSDCEIPDRPIGAGQSLCDLQWVDLFRSWDDNIAKILKVIGMESRTDPPYPSTSEASAARQVGQPKGQGASARLPALKEAIEKLSLLSEEYRQKNWRDTEGMGSEQVMEFKNNYFALHRQIVDFFARLGYGVFSLDELVRFSQIQDRILLEHELTQRRLAICKMWDFYHEVVGLSDKIRSRPIFNLQRALQYGKPLVLREVDKDGQVTADTMRAVLARQRDNDLEYVHGKWFLTKLFAEQQAARIEAATMHADELEARFEKPSSDEKAALTAFKRNEDPTYNTRSYEIAYHNWLHGVT